MQRRNNAYLLTALAVAALLLGAGPAAHAGDCAAARDPARCEAQAAAKATCRDRHGPAYRECLVEVLPRLECAAAQDRQRCEQRLKLRAGCKGKRGPARQACLDGDSSGKK